ncbi:MAG: ABC-type branched-chain amino acid transport system periplasmic component-like protein [Cypionkella sp.]|uniref:penicillin-binding protein activator n=1 Tax=Cypionkella sp. TaxID=2811411 RepID=UPI0026035E60|nr:penicillin-binding protein activator [Cypionkella sp.]MDB5659817.1 ABC-type branched-chain amino acid transport system periplasmic component-like protein [Cypionkella sp.]MDB5666036.1 ABC-type branched-chain amino acid transport system periplasmic component-like protein [Cypionkella sp.]
MLSVLNRARKSLGQIVVATAAVLLAACVPAGSPTAGSGSASGKIQVALLVPAGSGQASDELLARSLQNATRMAISDLGGSAQVDLRVYNTAGQPAQAAAMASKAVAEGAQVILGPVFAQEANAAGVAVAGSGVNVLAFSNNPDIAGNNVFVLGPTFGNTASRLATYAVRQGKSQVMIVNDRNTAGEIGRAAIAQAVAAAGGTVVATGNYEFSQNGVVAAAPGIAASAKSSGAQAVFLTADTAGALPLVSQLLTDNGLSSASAQFIGLTRWDIPAATLGLPGVQGGWFALPDPALYAQYQSRYQSTFNEPPHPISGLAYDGMAAIGALMKKAGSGPLSKQALTQGAGFVGVNGIFRLRSDGTNERGLAIAQIQSGRAVVVDPAPRSFGGFGS